MANDGVWGSQRLLSPASAEYGGSIWRKPFAMIPAELQARLPDDLVWFAGHMGQFMVIIPSRNLVMLRMGVAFDKPLARNQVFAAVADMLDQGL